MANKPANKPEKKPVAEMVFDFLKANPSVTQTEIRDVLDIDASRISPALVELFKKGLIGRHPTPNTDRSQSGGRRTVYRYWTVVDEYVRKPGGAKKGVPHKSKAKAKVSEDKANKIKALVNDWEKDLIVTTTGSTPAPPSSIVRPAPAATEANTVHHNVMVTINLPPALMRLIEKLA